MSRKTDRELLEEIRGSTSLIKKSAWARGGLAMDAAVIQLLDAAMRLFEPEQHYVARVGKDEIKRRVKEWEDNGIAVPDYFRRCVLILDGEEPVTKDELMEILNDVDAWVAAEESSLDEQGYRKKKTKGIIPAIEDEMASRQYAKQARKDMEEKYKQLLAILPTAITDNWEGTKVQLVEEYGKYLEGD